MPTDLQITYLSPTSLKPWAKNARTHSKKQIRQLVASIEEFGFTNPILIDADNTVLAGHGRLAAAEKLAMGSVPCVRIETMTAAQKRAYVLADNKLALNAGWDEQLLAEVLKGLLAEDTGFDVSLTGFSIAEVDALVEGLNPEDPGDPDDDALPPLKDGTAHTRLGDIWALGPHRLICGSALDPAVVDALMDGERAQMAFTDPPTTFKSMATLVVSAQSSTASSRWPRAR